MFRIESHSSSKKREECDVMEGQGQILSKCDDVELHGNYMKIMST
jgi:hypothetical protein